MSVFLPSLMQHNKNKENFNNTKLDVILEQDDILLPDTLNQLVSDSFKDFKKEENILKEEVILPDSPEFFELNVKGANDNNSNILNEISIDEEEDLTQLSKVELSRALVDLIVRNSESTMQPLAKKRKIENEFGKKRSPNTSYTENGLSTSMSVKKCKLNINSEKETTTVSQLTLDNVKKTEENHDQCEIVFATVDNNKKAASQKSIRSYYYCNSCNFQQLERYLIIQHIEKKHPKIMEKNSGDEKAFTIISMINNENTAKSFAVYCGTCKKKYKRSTLNGIEMTCCNQQMVYICYKCGAHNKCKKTMYNHMHKMCVPDHHFQCRSCNYMTFQKKDIQWHHWRKHLSNDAITKGDKTLLKQYCSKCHIIYKSEECANPIKTCLKCGEGLLRKIRRKQVLPNSKWSTIYCCNSCNYTTKKYHPYLQFHIWVKHGDEDQSYNEPQKVNDYLRTFCFHCNRISGPVVLETKCKMCNRPTMHTCSNPTCNVGYTRQASLYTHINNVHLTGRSNQGSIQSNKKEQLRVHKSTCSPTSSVNDLSRDNARTVGEFCRKKFHNSKGLLVHQMQHCQTP